MTFPVVDILERQEGELAAAGLIPTYSPSPPASTLAMISDSCVQPLSPRPPGQLGIPVNRLSLSSKRLENRETDDAFRKQHLYYSNLSGLSDVVSGFLWPALKKKN